MGKRKAKKEESDDDDYDSGVPAKSACKRRAAPVKAKKEEPTDVALPRSSLNVDSGCIESKPDVGTSHDPASSNAMAGPSGTVSAELVNEKRVRCSFQPAYEPAILIHDLTTCSKAASGKPCPRISKSDSSASNRSDST